ncbi:serine hydrolase domain-containing protein [Paenibacillus endoradicis]|uniref:serine hydrolase domain-containing protein n=1 Tax=Paenibacillus endoradicis TaxID=2972487 RepID=UPI002159634E|nr:serine hydrolase domain-containing protein [Paenibacillus endoradicis]MCR8655825.1 beta-lactamase family protein [Paenibacillus endoradicis]MCR8658151.1 beta-lactamase family protein [Paenibacillus endoradicis]
MKEISFSSLEQAGISVDGVQRIRTAATQMVEDNITPTQVIVAARRGTLLVHQADGKFGPEPEAPKLTVDALFPLCSITKLFTATSIMMLVEQGRIGLNRPVSDYIPEFTGEGKTNVCVHHLLTHTSGLDTEAIRSNEIALREKGEIPEPEPNQDPDIHSFLYSGYTAPLISEPGTIMSYSGYGYELLGEIIRRVSGQAYDKFVHENLFQPIGMTNTYYCVPQEVRKKVVRRIPEAACAEWIESEYQLNSISAGGGAYSTAMDLAIFGQTFLNGGIYNGVRLLSPVTVKEMTRNQIPGVSSQYRDEVFPEAYWGYGWAINGTKRDGGDLLSANAYSHWGAAGPFLCVDPIYQTVTVHFSVELDHQKPFKNMYVDYFNNTVLAAIIDL